MQQAAGLGLEGVAATVQAAHNSLEAVAASLNGGYNATDNAASTLGTITDQTRRSDATERLAAIAGHLDQAGNAVTAANGSAHEAYNYPQQAEIDSLTATLGGVFDGLGGARQGIEDAKTKTEAYRQHVESLGNL